MSSLKIRCPSCKQILQAAASQAGSVIQCSSCQAKIRVPRPKPAVPAPTPGLTPVDSDEEVVELNPGNSHVSGLTPLDSPALTPLPANTSGLQPLEPGSGLQELTDDEYQLSPLGHAPSLPPASSPNPAPGQILAQAHQRERARGADSEETFWNSSVLGGVATMALSTLLFVGGLYANRIFYFAPVIFVMGLIAVVKGVAGGRVS